MSWWLVAACEPLVPVLWYFAPPRGWWSRTTVRGIERDSSEPVASTEIEECQHDWREDPEGWKDDDPMRGSIIFSSSWSAREAGKVRDESILFVCAKCGQSYKEWRKVIDVQDWPEAKRETDQP